MASSPPLLFKIFFFIILTTSTAQPLSPSQYKTLLRLPRLLEYPPSLSPLTPSTDFCSLPPSPSLTISCTNGRLTRLLITGTSHPLSPSFSTDSFFTTLSRFPALAELSLVSLAIPGLLPSKIDRLTALQSLNLTSNQFTGPIPSQISQLTSLKSLVLANNNFNGTVPDLTHMTLLEELDLRNNGFRTGISTLASMDKLQKLDLSSNKLIGPVPAFLFALPSIQYLDLSGNRLVGALPATLSCGNALAFVDFSSNLLVGSLPSCIRANSSGRVVLSSWNCLSSGDPQYQHPGSFCNQGALAAVLPPVSEKSAGSKSKLGLIAGIAGGAVGGAAVLGLLLFVVFKRGRTETKMAAGNVLQKPVARKVSIHVASQSVANARHMSQAVRIGTLGLTPYRVFTMEELDEATNSFDSSNSICDGPQGKFYKGWLRDGSKVVVRCMKLKQKHSPQTLTQYMDVILKLRHCHLVSILGHCIDNVPENPNTASLVFLVFEYVSNGTLRSHLTEWRKREMLKWRQRVAAVIGVARGIQFLHTVAVPGILGNDLNIENILLDETLTAKISNYNLPVLPKNKNNKDSESPFSLVEDTNHGSIHNLEHGEKEDVYQLGLILLEVITGKPADSQGGLDELKSQLEESLNEESTRIQGMTDPTIRGTFAYDSLRTAVEVALNCVAKDPRERPSIDDVLWNLQYSVQVQDGWTSSENLSTQS